MLAAAEASMRLAGAVYLKKLFVRQDAEVTAAENDFAVLCLGESTTAGLWAHRHSYPRQLSSRLAALYPSQKIKVIVPAHVGQNTSQMANRIDQYLRQYRPDLIVVMAGVNNQWAYSESHITRFLESGEIAAWKLRALVWLSKIRLFRLAQYTYFRYLKSGSTRQIREWDETNYVAGGPGSVGYPPAAWLHDFAVRSGSAFEALWEYDMDIILRAARRHDVPAVLMTYARPIYVSAEKFERMADRYGIPLVRNDLVFEKLIRAEGGEKYFFDDLFHPTKEGYAVITDNLLEVIPGKYLPEPGAPPPAPN